LGQLKASARCGRAVGIMTLVKSGEA